MEEQINTTKMVVRVIIEVAGFPKEHVEQVIKKMVDRIKEQEKILRSDIFEAKQIKEFWSTFTEMELSFEGMDHLSGFCFEYMPSSLEILEPERLRLESKDFENAYNDLLGKLHHYDMSLKNTNAANLLFQKKLRELNINPEDLVKSKKEDKKVEGSKEEAPVVEEEKQEAQEEDVFFTKLGNKV